jgi:hypothetical protein
LSQYLKTCHYSVAVSRTTWNSESTGNSERSEEKSAVIVHSIHMSEFATCDVSIALKMKIEVF